MSSWKRTLLASGFDKEEFLIPLGVEVGVDIPGEALDVVVVDAGVAVLEVLAEDTTGVILIAD